MDMHFYRLEVYFQQKLNSMNDDIQFFQNYIKEFKSKNPDKAKSEIPDFYEIRNAVDQLSEKFKIVIVLRDIQGLSYEDISDIINVPIGTVKSRINRARLQLQVELKHLKK